MNEVEPMGETAKLIIHGKTYEFLIVRGTEGERAIHISTARQRTGLITLDPGHPDTGGSDGSRSSSC